MLDNQTRNNQGFRNQTNVENQLISYPNFSQIY